MAPKNKVSDEEIRNAIDALGGHYTIRELASVLNMSPTGMADRLRRFKGEQAGIHEPVLNAPIVRQSRLTNAQGDVVAQWDIRVPNRSVEDIKKLIDEVKNTIEDEIEPQDPVFQLETCFEDHLMNQYVFSDVHIGLLLADLEENDPKQAEELVIGCFEKMIADAPRARTATVVILGDWFHFDQLNAITSRSGHTLFANLHYNDMAQAGVRIARKVLNTALKFHENVDVVVCDGNHDDIGALWLRMLLMVAYEQETRIKFVDSDDPFYCHQFGQVFLGYHHGHEKSFKDSKELLLFFADKFKHVWADTSYRYIDMGHLHHLKVTEETGAIIRQHPTLSGRDFHSKMKGYRSKRAAICTTFSKDYGEVGQTVVRPEMLRVK